MLSAGFSIGSSYSKAAALRCWLRVPLHRFAVPLPFQGRLGESFSVGSSYAKEAAISGVYLANWGSIANRLRRKSPAQALRPFQGRLAAGFSVGRSYAKEAAFSGVYLANWGSIANRLRRKSPAGAPRFGQKNGKFPRESAVPKSFSKKICDFAKKHLLFFVKYAKIGMYEKSARIASVLRVHALFS